MQARQATTTVQVRHAAPLGTRRTRRPRRRAPAWRKGSDGELQLPRMAAVNGTHRPPDALEPLMCGYADDGDKKNDQHQSEDLERTVSVSHRITPYHTGLVQIVRSRQIAPDRARSRTRLPDEGYGPCPAVSGHVRTCLDMGTIRRLKPRRSHEIATDHTRSCQIARLRQIAGPIR